MRLGYRVPLPGPFYLHRGRGGGVLNGLWTVFVVLPVLLFVVTVELLAAACVGAYRGGRACWRSASRQHPRH